MSNNKTLFLLVGPSASGKSHLLNYLTQKGLQRIVSTTTRPMRPGEVDGVDYHFISDLYSKAINAEKGFVEKVEYAGVTYGVTHEEFEDKLKKGKGVAFLIVEPTGLERYFKYCKDHNVTPLTIYIHTPDVIRFQRLKDLAENDWGDSLYTESGVDRIIRSAVHEKYWKSLHAWDYILDGTDTEEENYVTIMNITKGEIND